MTSLHKRRRPYTDSELDPESKRQRRLDNRRERASAVLARAALHKRNQREYQTSSKKPIKEKDIIPSAAQEIPDLSDLRGVRTVFPLL